MKNTICKVMSDERIMIMRIGNEGCRFRLLENVDSDKFQAVYWKEFYYIKFPCGRCRHRRSEK